MALVKRALDNFAPASIAAVFLAVWLLAGYRGTDLFSVPKQTDCGKLQREPDARRGFQIDVRLFSLRLRVVLADSGEVA